MKKPAIAGPIAPRTVDALGKAVIDPEDGDENADETEEEEVEQQEKDEEEAFEQDSVDEAMNAERAPVKKAFRQRSRLELPQRLDRLHIPRVLDAEGTAATWTLRASGSLRKFRHAFGCPVSVVCPPVREDCQDGQEGHRSRPRRTDVLLQGWSRPSHCRQQDLKTRTDTSEDPLLKCRGCDSRLDRPFLLLGGQAFPQRGLVSCMFGCTKFE